MPLTDEQPPPAAFDPAKPCVWDLVANDAMDQFARSPHICRLAVEDMRARDRKGAAQYGCRLQPDNGRDALADSYQEMLDACVYARQAMYEARHSTRQSSELTSLYRRMMAALFDLREIIDQRMAGGR